MQLHPRGRIPRWRQGLGATGMAVIALSLLVLVSPVWAAKPPDAGAGNGSNGNSDGTSGGNEGDVKVVDAVTGEPTQGNNEPQVCSFFLVFSGADVGEEGTWWIVDWPDSGADPVASGTYTIGSDGTDETGTYTLPAGHYRVEWQGLNETSFKHKTFWVESGCNDPADEPPADEPPADEPPADEPPADEPPVDEPPADQPPADEPPVDEPPADEPVDDPGQPEQEVSAGTGEPIVDALPDTAVPLPALSGLGAALGILMVIAGHVSLRVREATPEVS